MPFAKLHISGHNFGDLAETCYIPVFHHGLVKEQDSDAEKLVLIGNIFMQDYYVVYDMSPLERGQKYI